MPTSYKVGYTTGGPSAAESPAAEKLNTREIENSNIPERYLEITFGVKKRGNGWFWGIDAGAPDLPHGGVIFRMPHKIQNKKILPGESYEGSGKIEKKTQTNPQPYPKPEQPEGDRLCRTGPHGQRCR